MKIAIVSDIHGNLTALESVLPAVKHADRVVCLGDVAAIGPQPHETLDVLRKLRWPCVMGNADEALANSTPEDYAHVDAPVEREKLLGLDRWTAAQLEDSDRRFLSRFRSTIVVTSRHISLLCYHGSPRSNTEAIPSTVTDQQLSEILAGKDATVYAGGHTHAQMVRKFKQSLVINPGSVGLPFLVDDEGKSRNPTWAEYAMITSSKDGLTIELRRIRYSLEALTRAVKESGMPDANWWLSEWFDPRVRR